jgi:hypothetical protein
MRCGQRQSGIRLREQIRLTNELYNLTKERVRQGVAAELDAIRAMQSVNTLEQQRREAEHNQTATPRFTAGTKRRRIGITITPSRDR